MKIIKYSEFINEAVAVAKVIDDFVKFLEESPVVVMDENRVEDKTKEGWLAKEHKMYSLSGIKKYFKDKYGDDYTALSIDNAVAYAPNIKRLTNILKEKGMTLQTTTLKGQYGDNNWFYSVDLSDAELEKIKEKYEKEFSERYSKYQSKKEESKKASVTTKKAAPKKAAKKAAPKKAAKNAAKKAAKKAAPKNEALQFLFEGLFSKK